VGKPTDRKRSISFTTLCSEANMGLDITAYSKLTKVPHAVEDDGEDYLQVYANPHFPGRAKGLEDGAYYSFDASMGFRAGSYSGYHNWREQLARMAGYAPVPYSMFGDDPQLSHQAGAFEVESGPFWELICFSDCEGTIGPVVSAKLLQDFRDYDEVAKKLDENFYAKYSRFTEAFAMAADGGAVDFH
jgi:hypothetical protein